MIPVSIEGVRRNFGISSVFMYTVTLIDETGQRIFNILVERHEALPIVAALHNLPLPRPQTINVMANTLKFHSITLPEVQTLLMGFSKTAMGDARLKELKASLAGKAPPFPEENLEQRKKDSLTFLLGSARPPLST